MTTPENSVMPCLKKCPFCGETAKLWNDGKVSCTNPGCGCFRSAPLGVPVDNAAPFYVDSWNTRASTPTLSPLADEVQMAVLYLRDFIDGAAKIEALFGVHNEAAKRLATIERALQNTAPAPVGCEQNTQQEPRTDLVKLPCWYCNGTGKRNESECSLCRGVGEGYFFPAQNTQQSAVAPTEQRCRHCRGAGCRHDGEPDKFETVACEDCNGTGQQPGKGLTESEVGEEINAIVETMREFPGSDFEVVGDEYDTISINQNCLDALRKRLHSLIQKARGK